MFGSGGWSYQKGWRGEGNDSDKRNVHGRASGRCAGVLDRADGNGMRNRVRAVQSGVSATAGQGEFAKEEQERAECVISESRGLAQTRCEWQRWNRGRRGRRGEVAGERKEAWGG